MFKNLIKRMSNRLGYQMCTIERFGVDVEHDLGRLTAMEPITTLFDVGANLGQTARRFARAFPAADIYSFEPVPQTFALLREGTAEISRVRVFDCALGDEPGKATIHLAASSVSNSLFRSGVATGQTVEVTVDTLDAFAKSHGVNRIDLLKIDVEGAELKVLRGGRQLLADGRVRYVYAECNFAANPDGSNADFYELAAHLSESGFCVVAVYAESFSLRHGSCLSNVLFARRSLLPSSVGGRTRNIT